MQPALIVGAVWVIASLVFAIGWMRFQNLLIEGGV